MTHNNSTTNENLDAMNDDELERKIGLLLDGRLDAASAANLRKQIEMSPRSRRTLDDLRGMQRAIASVPVPPPSRELLGRTLERVAGARVAREREILVLPWIRGVAVAAALVIGTNAFMFGTVAADSDTDSIPTVEDRFQNVGGAEKRDSITDYLAWYFLGRGR
jgi:anti-sigma factor RsiW